jgi:hypothetical protein
MPFYQVIYLLPKADAEFRGGFRCQVCGAEPTWHPGVADRPDLPIQLRCDNCLTQCAEFTTTQERDREIAELHEKAVAYNHDITFAKANFHN